MGNNGGESANEGCSGENTSSETSNPNVEASVSVTETEISSAFNEIETETEMNSSVEVNDERIDSDSILESEDISAAFEEDVDKQSPDERDPTLTEDQLEIVNDMEQSGENEMPMMFKSDPLPVTNHGERHIPVILLVDVS